MNDNFERITEAYSVLADAEKRRIYDIERQRELAEEQNSLAGKKKAHESIGEPVLFRAGSNKAVQLLVCPGFDIRDIVNEFDQFVREKKNQSVPLKGGTQSLPAIEGGPNATPRQAGGIVKNELEEMASYSGYSYHEGPPGVHVFTFPDQQSRDEFVQRLFSKGMVMMPNGSRHFEDYQREHMLPSVVPSPTPQTTKSRLRELKANGK